MAARQTMLTAVRLELLCFNPMIVATNCFVEVKTMAANVGAGNRERRLSESTGESWIDFTGEIPRREYEKS